MPDFSQGPINLGIMASHGGTNLQAIMDACTTGSIYGSVRVVVSNNSRSKALKRAGAQIYLPIILALLLTLVRQISSNP